MGEQTRQALNREDYLVVVPFAHPPDADQKFAEWLRRHGLTPEALEPEDAVLDVGRGLDGQTVKSFRVLKRLAQEGG